MDVKFSVSTEPKVVFSVILRENYIKISTLAKLKALVLILKQKLEQNMK